MRRHWTYSTEIIIIIKAWLVRWLRGKGVCLNWILRTHTEGGQYWAPPESSYPYKLPIINKQINTFFDVVFIIDSLGISNHAPKSTHFPIFPCLPSSLVGSPKIKMKNNWKEGRQQQQTLYSSIFPTSPSRSFVIVALGPVVWHALYPPVHAALPADVHRNELLAWFMASGFWNTINTGPSLKFLSDILLLLCVMEILWQWLCIWAWVVAGLVGPGLHFRKGSEPAVSGRPLGPALPQGGEGWGQLSHCGGPRGGGQFPKAIKGLGVSSLFPWTLKPVLPGGASVVFCCPGHRS